MEYSRKGRYRIAWNCHAHDHTIENKKNIISQFSKKYNIPKCQIKIAPNLIHLNENGEVLSVRTEIIDNIQSPQFQQKLFQDYINMSGLDGIDFDYLLRIDNEINEKVDYGVYDKFGLINFKWIEFKNFLSYGSEFTRIDFNKLHGLQLISGTPQNKTGKTTAFYESIMFLLYNDYSKAKTLDDLFNLYLPNETEMVVRGCIVIDGEEFVIERTLTRPRKRTEKSKASGSIKYYKALNGLWDLDDPLIDYNNEDFKNETEDVNKTNKKIKELLPKKEDFKLVVFSNSENLSSLIHIGATEKGKLFSRWLGLLSLDQKAELAKDKWTKEINPKLLSNQYSKDELEKEIVELKTNIETSTNKINELNKKLNKSNDDIKKLENEKVLVLSTKNIIDENILKLDIETVNKEKKNCVETGGENRAKETQLLKKINELKDLVVDDDKIKSVRLNIGTLTNDITTKRGEINTIKVEIDGFKKSISYEENSITILNKRIEELEKSKICPTCNRELDETSVKAIEDNIKTLQGEISTHNNNITKHQEDVKKNIDRGIVINDEITSIDIKKTSLEEELEKLEITAKKVDERTKDELKLAQVRVEISDGIAKYKQIESLLLEYNKNKENIDKNNNIDILITNLDIKIKTEQSVRDNIIKDVSSQENNIKNCQNDIKTKEDIIGRLFVESKYVKHFKLYQDLLGKQGIRKIILRKVIPILNNELDNLMGELDEDFGVYVEMNDKNDVIFYIVKYDEDGNEIKTNLVAASGFESTIASLCLRTVLSKMSTISTVNFVLYDEVIAKVGPSNYGTLYKLLELISKNHQFILVISHSTEFNQLFDNQIRIIKENNISRIAI